MLRTVAEVLARHIAGVDADAETLAEAARIAEARARDTAATADGLPPTLAVIPIKGVIAPRSSGITRASGMTSNDEIAAALTEAASDPAVRHIILDINSPGGSTAGGAVVARTLRDLRGRVPVTAQVQYTGTSLAYWIAANASDIVAAPGSLVGSIGTYLIHDDLSEALRQRGIQRTYVSAGEFKTDPNEAAPLSPAAKTRLQHLVDQSMAQFTGDVAAGRRIPLQAVLDGFGKGNVVTAEDALPLGMVETIARLGGGRVPAAAPAPAPALALTLDDTPAATDRRWRLAAEHAFRAHAYFNQ
jgi:signal peptide peptidase SppA